jgi:hypothetical protein
MTVEPTGNAMAVTGAIRHAARMTGADFQYLLATAQVESNFNPNARVATSSARGLFQFIEQTWLATLKEQGPALGYGPYANAIARLPSGEYAVIDPRMHRAVMNLRSDPTANAVMAGAYTRANAAKLAEQLGRAPNEGELYVAHFLGPGGAGRLIALAQSRPQTEAAAVFPAAARANRAMFYDRQGRARGARPVYQALAGRYRAAPAGKSDPTMLASQAAAPPRAAFVADPARLADTYAAAARVNTPSAARVDTGPIFHGLFRSAAAEPVAPAVSALWSAPAQGVVAPPAAGQQPAAATQGPGALDLFQEQLPDARLLFRGRV